MSLTGRTMATLACTVVIIVVATPALAQEPLADSAAAGTVQLFTVESWVVGPPAWAPPAPSHPRGSQAAVTEEAAGRMRWVVGGYLHAVDISATNTLGDVEVPIEVGFGDLFSKIEVPFSLHLEGMKGPWGFGVDYLYIRVGDEGIVETPLPIEITAGGNFITSAFEAFGIYRIGQPADRSGSLDLLVGARWKRLALNMEISGLPETVGGGFDRSWWDILAGARWIKQVHPRVGLVARADFGADLWQVIGGAGINVWRKLDLLVYYRHIDVDHSEGSGDDFFAYEGTESGPMFGFALHF